MKNYCFTEEEIKEIIKYFEFALEKNILIDKNEFIDLLEDNINHNIWG